MLSLEATFLVYWERGRGRVERHNSKGRGWHREKEKKREIREGKMKHLKS